MLLVTLFSSNDFVILQSANLMDIFFVCNTKIEISELDKNNFFMYSSDHSKQCENLKSIPEMEGEILTLYTRHLNYRVPPGYVTSKTQCSI